MKFGILTSRNRPVGGLSAAFNAHGLQRRALVCETKMSSTPHSPASAEVTSKQLLHLVFGGELTQIDSIEFADVAKLDIIGIYPNYAEAHKAWKAAAQRTVDNAHMRYFIVHMHRLLDPATAPAKS
jgi:hypothetical protein